MKCNNVLGFSAYFNALLDSCRTDDSSLNKAKSIGGLGHYCCGVPSHTLERQLCQRLYSTGDDFARSRSLEFIFYELNLMASLVTLVLSKETFSSEGERKEEYYLLLVLSVLGAVVLIQSSHMVSLLLGMELMGVALYAMIAFPERGQLPLEGAVKYLVLSACASAMLLYGFALIYAATGELSYAGIGARAALAYAENPMLMMAGSAMGARGNWL